MCNKWIPLLNSIENNFFFYYFLCSLLRNVLVFVQFVPFCTSEFWVICCQKWIQSSKTSFLFCQCRSCCWCCYPVQRKNRLHISCLHRNCVFNQYFVSFRKCNVILIFTKRRSFRKRDRKPVKISLVPNSFTKQTSNES